MLNLSIVHFQIFHCGVKAKFIYTNYGQKEDQLLRPSASQADAVLAPLPSAGGSGSCAAG